MTNDVVNTAVLALGEALGLLGIFYWARAEWMLRDVARREKALERLEVACRNYEAAGQRSFDDARRILAECERKGAVLVPGLDRAPPKPERPH